ncbi:MAG: acyltransferase [Bacteroidales bacterium]|nr:acyltransferase [Bacteroidales bacterium]
MTQTNAYLASKPRYEILDGLRGVAAMIVVAFHLFETYSPGTTSQIINHGYLAVDFFFVLSGFVIGYAYDDRWDKMTTWQFFKRRFVRLHPMLVMGTLVGVVLFYFGGDWEGFEPINQTPWYMVLAVFALACLMFPLSSGMDIRGWQEFNPLNGPTWTLSWEYIANVLYALIIRRFSKLFLSLFVAIAAAFTVILCFNIDVFGVLAARSYASHTVIGGWSLTPDQLQIGLTRLCYPFFGGLLLSRLFQQDKDGRSVLNLQRFGVRGGFWWCALAIVILLFMPRVGGACEANFWMNGLYESVCILLIFPLIVAIGAGSKVTGTTSVALCKFSGDISYPLYISHYPFIYMQMSWVAKHQDLPTSTHIFVSVCVFIMSIATAYALLKLYDLPVREWLRKKLF